ncbi:hypothetical protein [Chryseolinea soli]|uniref:Uncharacterized protein n=1 Tax=Chryseolinea soli TaxID=2321403 RepID=A0A385STH6_9BACT|nr:hypothetical protein [Chryseolinea soli]AYB33447.1 hypothetical protein D4L85_23920 [Chryseolinea soli]
MVSPLTRVLTKIFVKGFYRVHAGLLLFFFVTLLTYGFFINVLNETHLTPADRILNNLILVLTLLSSPLMVIVVFVAWFFYTVKSWDYVLGQMTTPANEFLYYSSTAMPRRGQAGSWFVVQLLISVPMIVYALFSIVVGAVYHYYLVPVIIVLYIVLLSGVSAGLYAYVINRRIRSQKGSWLSGLVRGWDKPFFSLFLYAVMDKLKVAFVVTKLLSALAIIGGFHILTDVREDTRAAGMVTLGMVMAHALLLYQSYRFEHTALRFSLNFPYRKIQVYVSWGLTYALLTLPEILWLFTRFEAGLAWGLLLFHVSAGLLVRSILYRTALDMKKFIYAVFYFFILSFAAIVLKLLCPLVIVTLATSWIVFQKYYYKQTP